MEEFENEENERSSGYDDLDTPPEDVDPEIDYPEIGQERRYDCVITTSREYTRPNGSTGISVSLGGNKAYVWDGILQILRATTRRPNAKVTHGIIPAHVNEGAGVMKHTQGKVGRHRQTHLINTLSMLIYDVEDHDYGTDDGETIAQMIEDDLGVRFAAYTSYNHGNPDKWSPNHPRLRIIIPLARNVSHPEFEALWTHFATKIQGIDSACGDVARHYYLPVPGPDEGRQSPQWIVDRSGPLLDPDHLRGASLPDLVAALEAKKSEKITTFDTTFCGKGIAPDDLKVLLDHVDGALTYEGRLPVRLALHHAAHVAGIIHPDVALAAYDAWSRPHASWTPTKSQEEWEGIQSDRPNPVTMGTLIHKARQNGWVPPRTWTSGERLLDGTGDRDLADRVIEHLTWRQDAFDFHAYKIVDGIDTSASSNTPETRITRIKPENLATWQHESTLQYADGSLWHPNPDTGVWEVLTPEHVSLILQGWNRKLLVKGKLDQNGEPSDPTPFVFADRKASAVYKTLVAAAKASQSTTFFDDPDRDYAAVRVQNGTIIVFTGGPHYGHVAFIPGPSPIGMGIRGSIPMEWVPTWDAHVPEIDPYDFSRTDHMDVRWSHWLHRWFGDEETVNQVVTYMGACMFGLGSMTQKVLILTGGGGNGKSAFINVMKRFFGNAVCSLGPHDLGKSRFSTLPLLNARLNAVADIKADEMLDTGLFKKITGGDDVPMEIKNGDQWSYVPICGHLWSCNDLPAVSDHSAGFWRRWLPIEWADTVNYSGGENEVSNLAAHITKQLGPAILRSLVVGMLMFARRDCKLPPMSESTKRTLAQWRNDTDVVMTFANARRADTWTNASVIWDAFKAYCETEGRQSGGKQKFYKRLRSLGIEERTYCKQAQFRMRAYVWDDTDDTTNDDAWGATPLPN